MKAACRYLGILVSAWLLAMMLGSQVVAQVTLPPAFCLLSIDRPSRSILTISRGINDSFDPQADPNPAPSLQFISRYAQLGLPTNTYDQLGSDYFFGDTLNFSGQLPTGAAIVGARLRMRLRALDGQPDNDAIHIQYGAQTFGYKLNNLPGANGWTASDPPHDQVFAFDFSPTAATPAPTEGTFPGPAQFLQALEANQFLDILIQDDTSVDYLRLDICYETRIPRLPDLLAQKTKTQLMPNVSYYQLQVQNLGGPITGPAKIEAIDYVPVGVSVVSIPSPPWTCNPNIQVTGPNVITCSLTVPSGYGVATGLLPPLTMLAIGTPGCPNCMRVNLYTGANQQLAEEINTDNNVSCIQ